MVETKKGAEGNCYGLSIIGNKMFVFKQSLIYKNILSVKFKEEA